MEKYIPLKIKALVCAGVAIGGLTACKPKINSGDTGVATDSMSLRTNVLSPNSDYCSINNGEKVKVIRQSYVDYGAYKEPVTLIKSDKCSGWTSDSNLSSDFDWNK